MGRQAVARERVGDCNDALRDAAAELADIGRQVTEIAHHARRLDQAGLRGQSADHVLPAEHLREDFLVAEAVLKAHRDRTATEQMADARRRRAVGESLALEQDDIRRADFPGGARGGDRDRAFAAVANQTQTVGADRLDVLSPQINQRHVEPALGEQGPEQAAHRASADDHHLRFLVRHLPVRLLRRRHDARRKLRISASSISLPR